MALVLKPTLPPPDVFSVFFFNNNKPLMPLRFQYTNFSRVRGASQSSPSVCCTAAKHPRLSPSKKARIKTSHVTGRLEKMQLAYHDKGKLSCEIHTMNHVHCSLWISLCASKWIPPRFLASVLGAAGEGPLGDKCEEGKGPAFLEGNDKHGIGVMSAALRIHYRRIQSRANEWVAIHDIDIQSFFAL